MFSPGKDPAAVEPHGFVDPVSVKKPMIEDGNSRLAGVLDSPVDQDFHGDLFGGFNEVAAASVVDERLLVFIEPAVGFAQSLLLFILGLRRGKIEDLVA